MVADLFAILWAPFLMCLVLTGIHAYLGVHVLAREVVFVDIAMAQIAALGATAAFLVGYETETWQSYAFGLAATLVGALVLALTRTRHRQLSHEAIIGVVYAVSSAGAVLLADRAAHGAEQVRTMLVGNLLAVRPDEVAKVAVLYSLVGALHWACRRPFFLISNDPQTAFEAGWRVRWWDFLFYASFGAVVTSSVRIAGVLLVFSYLIVPALAGVALGGSLSTRLLIGWGFGTLVSVIGMVASAAFDLPTGATVVCAFGATLVTFALGSRAWRRRAPLAVAALVMLLGATAGEAEAAGKVRVVTTIPDLKALTQAVGGAVVEVESLTVGTQWGHDAEVRPSMMLKLRRAQLLVENGLELDSWIDVAVQGAHNPDILRGARGRVEVARGLQALEVPTSRVDRSMGDVHPLGNPHFSLDPGFAPAITASILEGLARVAPEHRPFFERNRAAFLAHLAQHMQEWTKLMEPVRGAKVVAYHPDFIYLLTRFGVVLAGTVEDRPGVPPSPQHLVTLIRQMREQGIKVVIFEIFNDSKLAARVAQEAGARPVLLASAVGSVKGADDYISAIGYNVNALAKALRPGS
jgi:ABC-type Zn uptake system ZnuABC Zn-binding protein ZnuA/ABC-type Mn2+/Zn2+ transport system permease subunit